MQQIENAIKEDSEKKNQRKRIDVGIKM